MENMEKQIPKKKRHMDFILSSDMFEDIFFRFYPRQSSCHSFGKNPPKSWDEVYKVYYKYAIFGRFHDGYGKETYKIWDCICDECSEIDEVANRIKLILEGKTEIEIEVDFGNGEEKRTLQLLDKEIVPFGDGTAWIISRHDDRVGVNEYKEGYTFTLWRYDEVGYRFWMDRECMKKFGEFLHNCCEYMLAHGEPI